MIKRVTDPPLSDDHYLTKKQKVGDAALQTKPTSAPPEGVSSNTPSATKPGKRVEGIDHDGSVFSSPAHFPPTGDETLNNEDAVPVSTEKIDKSSKSRLKKTKKPPVSEGFAEFKRDTTVAPRNPFWGIKPLPGDARPDPIQPSARESNGQTNPPLWEDRGYRYKRGSRFVKYFGPIAPGNVKDLKERLDQEDLLLIKLIDMRPKSKNDPTPKRTPTVYCYGKKPKDWNDMQSIKALNDRRYQAIDRTTLDPPWTRIEREYLASLLADTPSASIWDLTERHNDRFMGKDFTSETGFGFANLSVGRTVESVRYEYITYKSLYDTGEAPTKVRWRGDQSLEAKTIRASGHSGRAFGPLSRVLEMAHDAEQSISDDEEDAFPSQEWSKKVSKAPSSRREDTPPVPFSDQQKLDDEDEILLELAGAYDAHVNSQPVSPVTLPVSYDESYTKEAAGGGLQEARDLVSKQPVSAIMSSPSAEAERDNQDPSPTGGEVDAPAPDAELRQQTAKKQDASDSSTVSHPTKPDRQESASLPEHSASKRRSSLNVVRKMNIDEDYDGNDDDGDDDNDDDSKA